MEFNETHQNPSLVAQKVHYTETHEDRVIEVSEISKSSMKYSGDCRSEVSISTSILDVNELDPKQLKKQLEDFEYKIKYLENENKQINEHLLFEKKKNSKLESKLQFVKDNQEVFMRLKEAYINMKYNEAVGRKMVEIRERAIQTWDGVICSSCIECEELRRQIDVMLQKYSELFIISPGEMEHLMNTVKYLKDLIDRREESWECNMERQHKLQSRIVTLENEASQLREVIAAQDCRGNIPVDVIEDAKLEQKLLEERKMEEMQTCVDGLKTALEKLRKIIIKYEKKFREINSHAPGKYTSPLNDKEMDIVQQIIIKYNLKSHRKVLEESVRSRSPVGSERTRQSHRPSSPLQRIKNRETKYQTSPERSKLCRMHVEDTQKCDESSIMMMDCLFE